ncbi:MAG: 3-isopropylmalate dehydratase large subunit [Planctomycetes bacterium]|nr:3-isopropylmalate dehydratase large subunit [Planctomycetota bacterium]
MPSTITEKILARAAGLASVKPGDEVWAKVETVLAHDATTTKAVEVLRSLPVEGVFDRDRVIMMPDHFVPAKDIKSAQIYKEVMDFARAEGLTHVHDLGDENHGVAHLVIAEEKHLVPGTVLVGGDSHTCMGGAFGLFAAGIGSTELGNVFATGDLWFRVPASIRLDIEGEPPPLVTAKDVVLWSMGLLGGDGGLWKAMEWRGSTVETHFSIESRMTLCNMAIEAGATSGICHPDRKTLDYLDRHDLNLDDLPAGDPGAAYDSVHRLDVKKLKPQVAIPNSPNDVHDVEHVSGEKVDQVYIGSCTGGKWEDFVMAARVLKGRKKAKGVRLMIVPASKKTANRIFTSELYAIFRDAGAVFSPPTCGACLGGYMGVLGPGDVAVTTTNRNFRGRMGSPDARIYLASPYTAAKAALTGRVEAPEESDLREVEVGVNGGP